MTILIFYWPYRTLRFDWWRYRKGLKITEWGHQCPDVGFEINGHEFSIRLPFLRKP